jgi:dGTPase
MTTNPRAERRHKPEGDDGPRTPFERDRDAILHSTCFRRLVGVTQVVAPGEGHVYHNRLTHTLEVAQIAQRLAESLKRKHPELVEKHGGLDPSVVEAAALVHDLGHPPFGHVAETTLNELVQKEGVVDGYEGNAQSFRIITKLSVRREDPEAPGLNLARASLNASLKYPWFQGPGQKEAKWGAYTSEREDFDFARAGHAAGDRAQSLEAQIMDWSDDIAYSVSDTEDFYRAGLIPLGQLVADAQKDPPRSPSLDYFMARAFERLKNKRTHGTNDEMKDAFCKLCDGLPLEVDYEPNRIARGRVRAVTSKFIGLFVKAVSIREHADSEGSLLDIDKLALMQVDMLKELTWCYVIKGPALAGLQHGQKHVIETLFNTFLKVAREQKPDKWDVLPVSSRDELKFLNQKYGSITGDQRVRVAADAVANMTDQQAIDMARRLTGVSPGSAFNTIVG